MKKLDKLLFKSFIGPFLLTSSIVLFIIVMQFLWKYIDDLVGKGLEWYIIAKLIFYASASFVPMALPLGILLSSVMTMGSMGEHYELVAFKTSGVSLFRIMRPLLLFTCGVALFAFGFNNYAIPTANLRFKLLLRDIVDKKPALNIEEGVFYDEIDGFSIKVGKKGEDNRTIEDVIVYDHTSGRGNDNILIAESGIMLNDESGGLLIMRLFNGRQYQEMKPKKGNKSITEHLTTHFETFEKKFDMNQFAMEKSDDQIWKNHHQMMNIGQLSRAMDTIKLSMFNKKEELKGNLKNYFTYQNGKLDSAYLAIKKLGATPIVANINLMDKSYTKDKSLQIIHRAISYARNAKSFVGVVERDEKYRRKQFIRHQVEWHRKFTMSLACLVLFFIGAPLGAIIRKGGMGLPILMSIIFFVILHVFNMIGEKMAEESAIDVVQGMWMSTMVLLPFGLFFSYKAVNDSRLFTTEWFYRLKNYLFKKNR